MELLAAMTTPTATPATLPVIHVPIPIALPPERPRCRAAVIDVADGQCAYRAITPDVAYCYTHRPAHALDLHTEVFTGYPGKPPLAPGFARCYDGYHGKWHGRRYDGIAPTPGAPTYAQPAPSEHCQCALRTPYPRLPHTRHSAAPA